MEKITKVTKVLSWETGCGPTFKYSLKLVLVSKLNDENG